MPRAELAAVDEQPARRGTPLPREHVEELVLSLSLECGDPEDLAGLHGERDVEHRVADAERLDRERYAVAGHDHAFARGCRPVGGRLRPRLGLRRLRTEHRRDDLLLASLGGHEDADVAAVAEDRRAVAVRDHLAQAVRDEEGGALTLLLPPHHLEDALREVRRERGRDLVEDQELRVARERAREVEHAEYRQRHVERLLRHIDMEVERVQLPLDRVGRDAGEPKVLSDRQVGHERGILEDRCQPEPRGRGGRGHLDRLAVDGDRPRVRPDHAGEQLDERALARAVGAEQRVHLARLDDERGRAQRDDRAVALGELPGLEEAAAVFAHVGRDRATGDVGGAAGAPPTVVMPLRAPCSS